MAESIVINADAFFDRLTHLYNLWKSDKRASDGAFGGVDTIVVLAGKAEQESSYQKHNALHVSPERSREPASHPHLQ
jgi:nucleosome binding factor SPN SPT16 subunit